MANFYNREEQETVIVYDCEKNSFDIYTSVPKHIRRLEKLYQIDRFSDIEKDSEGNHIGVRITVEKIPKLSTFAPR